LLKGEVRIASKLSVALAVVFVVSLLLASIVPFVAASSFFYRTYEGMGIGKAWSMVQTSDGGYALVGFTQSAGEDYSVCWLVKTDPDGNMEWNKRYEDGSANSIVQTGDGGYVIAGSTNSFGAGGSDFWLVKTDSVGNMEWNQTYGGSRDDSAKSMVQTSDWGYAIAGDTESYGVSFTDFLLVKTDSLGNMEWNKTYDAIKGRDYVRSVVQTSDGGYALIGETQSSVVEDYDCRLIKTDSFGNIEWNKTYGEGGVHPNSIVQTSDSGYAIAGDKGAISDFGFFKTDSAGNMEWNKTYGGLKSDYACSVVQTSDGGYALAGAKEQTNMLYTTMWLIKTVSSGNMEWNRTYGYGCANSVIQTSDGGYAMAGYKIEGFPTFCLVKTDEAGIIPEFPSLLLAIPLLIALTLFLVLIRRRLPRNKFKNRRSTHYSFPSMSPSTNLVQPFLKHNIRKHQKFHRML
jgi:hypothetical protein